jgi:sortase A
MLNVLGKTLTYQVDQIRVVLPDELDDLAIDDGQDYCTLVTCTPYGVNTHRLLVRGHRVPNQGAAVADGDVVQVSPAIVAAVITVVVLAVALLVRAVARVRRRGNGRSLGRSGLEEGAEK